MTDGPSAARTVWSRPVLILPLIAVLAGLVLRNAALLVVAENTPAPALSLRPPATGAPRRDPAPASRGSAGPFAAAVNPSLAAEPFFAAALESRDRGRRALAIRQMEEANRRDPRLTAAYVFLIEEYVRTGRIDEAIGKIAAVLRLPIDGERADRLMQALFLLASDAKARPVIQRALAANPPWRTGFIQFVARQGADPSLLFEVVRASAAEPTPRQSDEQRSFLAGLIAKQDYERAYLAWINFLPANAIENVSSVYDGNFRHLPGPPPFNWQLFPGGGVAAEMVDSARVPPGTALSASFFGDSRTAIAGQTLLLPPGDYMLSIAAAGETSSALGGSFVWELACLPAASVVATIEFTSLSEAATIRRATFSLPAQCKAQTLTLIGKPGETSAQISGEFGAISVKRR